MTYDTGKRILYVRADTGIKLSKLEHKLLICLSSENLTSFDEIQKRLELKDANYVRVLIFRLIEKTEYYLTIRTIAGAGYRLDTEIYFK